jgi:transcriptional antiterminator NusG
MMDWRERLRQMTAPFEEDESSIWHAIFVMTGNEQTVKDKIAYTFRNTNILPIVPKRRIHERKNGVWNEKIRPLFPGYILIKGLISTHDYYVLKTIPGILRVLRDEKEIYRIHPDEMRIISRLMINGELIGISNVFRKGDSIVITDGPLLGMEGLIQSIDYRKGRAKVCLSFLGDKRTVDLGIKVISQAT